MAGFNTTICDNRPSMHDRLLYCEIDNAAESGGYKFDLLLWYVFACIMTIVTSISLVY